MATTIASGPVLVSGQMGNAPANGAGFQDFNSDAGPGITYMGDSIPDVRYPWGADRLQGNVGLQPAFLNLPYLQSVDQIPATFGTAKLAALQNVTSGTALTLVSAASTGVALNIPLVPFQGSAAVTPALTLDFGFAWGNCTSGSTTIVVADSTQFVPGMPLVVAHVGGSSGNPALLTWVVSITDATHIVVNDAPQATNASTPIGTGNIWTPREGLSSGIYPTGHAPLLGIGPGLFLDPAQSVARGVSITGAASGVGGNFTVRGYDIYGQPMSETITATSGATTVYGKKAFKAIVSVTPAFTDAHNYSIGTSDVFGLHLRSDLWEYSNIFWAGSFMSASTGWVAGDATSPATATTGDVRGTVQTGTIGGGTGISGGSNSNGTVSSLAMTGRRLAIFQSMRAPNLLRATPQNTAPQTGVTQFTN